MDTWKRIGVGVKHGGKVMEMKEEDSWTMARQRKMKKGAGAQARDSLENL